MTDGVFDLLCREHGGLSHICVHEAAHGLAAVDHGMRFTKIEVMSPQLWWDSHGGSAAGGMSLPVPPAEWVRENPTAALPVLLAGAFAEQEFFRHHLDQSWHGDVVIWRSALELTGSDGLARAQDVLGESFVDVTARVRSWARDRRAAIRRIVAALSGVADASVATTVEVAERLALQEADVAALA